MPDRFIRESICTSDTLNELSDFEERFWHRLIVNCDDFGRFDARPAILKGKLFPLMDGKTKKDMSDALNKLASVGLVELYEVDGKPFLHVVKWSKYQRTRATKSKFPSPDNACCQLTANAPEDEYEYDIRPSICEDEDDTRTCDESAFVVVVAAYKEKVNKKPTKSSMKELKGYVVKMGAECCLRAFDVALDAKITTWPYIRGILEKKLSQGVRSLADWDAVESRREASATAKKVGKAVVDSQPSLERIQEHNEWIDEFLEKQGGIKT